VGRRRLTTSVLLAARSPAWRVRAQALLARQPAIRLLEVARDPQRLLQLCTSQAPDVILIGVEMLGEVPDLLRRLRARAPVPVLLLAGSPGDPALLAGLEEGAADFLVLSRREPGGPEERELAALLKQVSARGLAAASAPIRAPRYPTPPPGRPDRPAAGPRLVVIGASTGGPRAVQTVLEALPAELDAAIVVAIHLPPRFTPLYVERLARVCRLGVEEGSDDRALQVGRAYVLPGGTQGRLERRGDELRLRLAPRRRSELHAPSVDHVMRSAAAAAGAAAVGVILTGMGDDGAQGLLAIRSAGGYTVAESEQTALIFGMPGGAIRAGAAAGILPLEEIPAALMQRCGARRIRR